jgi:hypothetical protein
VPSARYSPGDVPVRRRKLRWKADRLSNPAANAASDTVAPPASARRAASTRSRARKAAGERWKWRRKSAFSLVAPTPEEAASAAASPARPAAAHLRGERLRQLQVGVAAAVEAVGAAARQGRSPAARASSSDRRSARSRAAACARCTTAGSRSPSCHPGEEAAVARPVAGVEPLQHRLVASGSWQGRYTRQPAPVVRIPPREFRQRRGRRDLAAEPRAHPPAPATTAARHARSAASPPIIGTPIPPPGFTTGEDSIPNNTRRCKHRDKRREGC